MNEEQLNQLRVIEQQLSTTSQQRQAYDQQLVEIENALNELKDKQEAYHIVGSIMIKKDAKKIVEELTQKHNLTGKTRYRDYIAPIIRTNALTLILLAIDTFKIYYLK